MSEDSFEFLDQKGLREQDPEKEWEKVQFEKGQRIFRRTADGKFDNEWFFDRIDEKGDSAYVYRKHADAGVETEFVQMEKVPLEQLKKEQLAGARHQDEVQDLADAFMEVTDKENTG